MGIAKKIKQIDLLDWDELVEKTYGKIYSFQQQDGCKSRGFEIITTDSKWEEDEYEDYEVRDYENDTIPEIINGGEMGVSFKAWLARDPNTPLNPSDDELEECYYYNDEDKEEWKKDEDHIELFWQRNFYPNANAIAEDLCKRGLLKPGRYQINIDW